MSDIISEIQNFRERYSLMLIQKSNYSRARANIEFCKLILISNIEKTVEQKR